MVTNDWCIIGTVLSHYNTSHYNTDFNITHTIGLTNSRSPIYSSIMSGWEKNTPILETVLAFLRQKCRF